MRKINLKWRFSKPPDRIKSTARILDEIKKAWANGGPNMMGYRTSTWEPFRPSPSFTYNGQKYGEDGWEKVVVTKEEAKKMIDRGRVKRTAVAAPEFNPLMERTGMWEVWSKW